MTHNITAKILKTVLTNFIWTFTHNYQAAKGGRVCAGRLFLLDVAGLALYFGNLI
jgi:hypothetical protein